MFRYIPARLGRDLTPDQVAELFERGEVFTGPHHYSRRGEQPYAFWPERETELIFTDRGERKHLCLLGIAPGTQITPTDLERFVNIHGEVRVISSMRLREPFQDVNGCWRLLSGKKVSPPGDDTS